MDDVISITDNKTTKTTFVRTRLYEDEDEAKAEAENFGLEAASASMT